MDIQTRKLTFIQKFVRLQNDKYITQLEHLLMQALKDENDFNPMPISQLNKRIDNSKNNEVIKSDVLLTEIENWN